MTRYLRTDPTTRTQLAEWAVIDTLPDQWLTGPAIQEYVDRILAADWPQFRTGPSWPVEAVIDDDVPTATYLGGKITTPHRVRAFVILHELAHHLSGQVPGFVIEYHDTVWVRAYLAIIEHVHGRHIADRFRLSFVRYGVIT